jgi:hypothetical protein
LILITHNIYWKIVTKYEKYEKYRGFKHYHNEQVWHHRGHQTSNEAQWKQYHTTW